MYEKFYHFKEKPFSLTPDPKFLYLSKQHQGALDHMLYGIQQREGFMVIMGDVGTGKTTLCRCLLDRMEKNVEVALVLNPMLSDMDLLRTCVQDLRVKPIRGMARVPAMAGGGAGEGRDESYSDWFSRASKKDLIDSLNAFLLAQHAMGKSTVLIIDEAQNLSLDVLEQLRILSNLETEKEKLIQIIFVGQLELNEKLKLPQLKQLNQRISIRYEITPLSGEESKNYINHRMLVAGAGARVVFSRSALKEIYDYAGGYPRLINLVCDRGLLAGFNDQTDTISSSQVKLAIRSLLGEEEKDYFVKRFLKNRLPLAASILFFALGLLFFYLSLGVPSSRTVVEKPPVNAVVSPEKNPAPAVLENTGQAKAREDQRTEPETGVEKTPAPQETASTNPVVESNAGAVHGDQEYRIQVYSLKSQSQAEEETRRLKEEGFQVFWKKAVTGGQDWYIVYVGPFNDLDSANIHVDALKYSGRVPILLSVSKTG